LIYLFQESFEAEHTLVDARLELDNLHEDNLKSLETLLRSEYPSYVPFSESEESGLDEEEDEDLEEADDDDDSDEVS
jgi:hypothetical protein